MLNFISIKDFAIIDSLELELDEGMTVLTGETGAGKSILVDALGLVLGDRLNGNPVRTAAEKADISAGFDINGLIQIKAWLNEHELSTDGDECILRRTISNEGRSRSYINSRIVTLQRLKQLGNFLVDIHGQHEHHSLLKKEQQRLLLDAYGGHEKQLSELAQLNARWASIETELEQLGGAGKARESDIELLRYQLDELTSLSLGEHEYTDISEEHQRLGATEKLIHLSHQALQCIDSDTDINATSLILQAIQNLVSLSDLDPQAETLLKHLESISIDLQEFTHSLQDYHQTLVIDPQRLAELDQRLTVIIDLARKHHVQAQDLWRLQGLFEEKLAAFEQNDARVEALRQQQHELLKDYRIKTEKLHQSRQKAAKKLIKEVTLSLHSLGMSKARISINIQYVKQTKPHHHGSDEIEFLFSANPGQSAQPLNKVASGGELSRISLALQLANTSQAGIHTLVFDEVDVGIGGGIAEVVGQKLKQLSAHRQVLCITHLPQVASQGEHHLQISKSLLEKSTRTKVNILHHEQRVDEIARMLGGIEMTEQTIAHAREMIQRSQ